MNETKRYWVVLKTISISRRIFLCPSHTPHYVWENLNSASTLIRHQNRRNFKTPAFIFVWTENRLKAELFESDGVTTMKWFPCPSFRKKTNPQWPVIITFSSCSDIVWTQNSWYVFRGNLRFQIPLGQCERSLKKKAASGLKINDVGRPVI